jgi:hypothetical protein
MSLGNVGGKGAQDVNIPSFQSAGGITPQQQAFGDYTYGENLDATGNEFGQSGTGMSTMATQAAGGANLGEAKQVGGMSDVNQGAQYAMYQGDVSNELQGLANQVANTQQETAALQPAAKALGTALAPNPVTSS